jgi:hypothetical protein
MTLNKPRRHSVSRDWWFDADTNCWRNQDQSACVARDWAQEANPWGAWHTSTDNARPDSRHGTLRDAIAACEAAKEAGE